MGTLEQVIKDLEFENEKLVRNIKEEIEYLDNMQNGIREKGAENEKLEEEIEKSNSEAKKLHEQFKQNKEITESLKSASSLLNRHVADLRTNLKMTCQETDRKKQELDKILSGYTEKWEKYEAEYEKRPLARQIRSLKLEAAKLDSEDAELREKKEKMESVIFEYEDRTGSKKKLKAAAIESILKISKTWLETESTDSKIANYRAQSKGLSSEIDKLNIKIQQKKNEIEEKKMIEQKMIEDKLKMEEEKKIESAHQKPWDLVQKKVEPVGHLKSNQPKKMEPSTRSFPKLQLPNFSKSSKGFSFPKMPQLPKFPSFPRKPTAATNSMPTKPDLSAPPSQLHLKQELPKPSMPKIPSVVAVTIPKPESNVLSKLEIPTLSKSPDVKTKQANFIQTPEADLPKQASPPNKPPPEQVKEEVKQTGKIPIGDFLVPIDQSSDEYFGLQRPMDVDDTTNGQTPKSEFFSPSHHAEKLKKFKESPGDVFYRKSRPMFDSQSNADGPPQTESGAVNARFATSFDSTALFLQAGHKPENNAMDTSEKDAPKNDSPSQFSFKKPMPNVSKPFQPSTFSFDSPYRTDFNVSGGSSDFSFDKPSTQHQPQASSAFSFNISESNNNQPSSSSAFSLNSPAVASPQFLGGFPGKGDGKSGGGGMFDFGASPDASDVPASPFNFGAPSAADDSAADSSFAFSFGGAPAETSNDDTSTFSFGF